MNNKLELPLKDIYITQPWGVNFVGFYKRLGMKGHNGVDFRAKKGCDLFSSHVGIVTYAKYEPGGGNTIVIASTLEGLGYKTIYCHLSKILVKKGDIVTAGQKIGETGNTGKYTTGSHLHFGLKKIYDGKTIDKDNGYKGAIDPSKYFKKNWDKSNAYHRYGRKGNYLAELKVRFKNPWLHRQLKKRGMLHKVYNNEFINALVYGGWDFESVINPAMYFIWGWSKKTDYIKGKINFK